MYVLLGYWTVEISLTSEKNVRLFPAARRGKQMLNFSHEWKIFRFLILVE
jgi:hypothetical protein